MYLNILLLQTHVKVRKDMINQHCDGLINEVEIKRGFFLSDLEYEEKNKVELLTEYGGGLQGHSTATQNLIHYAREVLKETDTCAFIQVTFVINILLLFDTSVIQLSLQLILTISTVLYQENVYGAANISLYSSVNNMNILFVNPSIYFKFGKKIIF